MQKVWLSLAQAARVVGRDPRAVKRILEAKGARRLVADGVVARWHAEDVARIAAGETPAREAIEPEVGS